MSLRNVAGWLFALTASLAAVVGSEASAHAGPKYYGPLCSGAGSSCPDDGNECTWEFCALNAPHGGKCARTPRPVGYECSVLTTSGFEPGTCNGKEQCVISKTKKCGNGKLNPDEECDSGASNSWTGACLPTCKAATCGDGHVQTGVEECDDGNAASGDGCSSTCKLESCSPSTFGAQIVVDPALFTRCKGSQPPGCVDLVPTYQDVYGEVAPDVASFLTKKYPGKPFSTKQGTQGDCTSNGAAIYVVLWGPSSTLKESAPQPFKDKLLETYLAMQPGPAQQPHARGGYAIYRDDHSLWIGAATTPGVVAGLYGLLYGEGFTFLAPGDHWTISPAPASAQLAAWVPQGQVFYREPSANTLGMFPTGGWYSLHTAEGDYPDTDPLEIFIRFERRAMFPSTFDSISQNLVGEFVADQGRCDAIEPYGLARIGRPGTSGEWIGNYPEHLPAPHWDGNQCVADAPADWPTTLSPYLQDPPLGPPPTPVEVWRTAQGWHPPLAPGQPGYVVVGDAAGDLYGINPTHTWPPTKCGTENEPTSCAPGQTPTIPDPDDYSLSGTPLAYATFLRDRVAAQRAHYTPDAVGPLVVPSGDGAQADFSPKTINQPKICALYGLTCSGPTYDPSDAWLHLTNNVAAFAQGTMAPPNLWAGYFGYRTLALAPHVPAGPGVAIQAQFWQNHPSHTNEEVVTAWRRHRQLKSPVHGDWPRYPGWSYDDMQNHCGDKPLDLAVMGCHRASDLWAGFEGAAIEAYGFGVASAPALYAQGKLTWIRDADAPVLGKACQGTLPSTFIDQDAATLNQTWEKGQTFRDCARQWFDYYVAEFFTRAFPTNGIRKPIQELYQEHWTGLNDLDLVTVRASLVLLQKAVAASKGATQAELDRLADIALYSHYQTQRAIITSMAKDASGHDTLQELALRHDLKGFVVANRLRLIPSQYAMTYECTLGGPGAAMNPKTTNDALALVDSDLAQLNGVLVAPVPITFKGPYVPLDPPPESTTGTQTISVLEQVNDAAYLLVYARPTPTHFKITHFFQPSDVTDPDRPMQVTVRSEFDLTADMCLPKGKAKASYLTGSPMVAQAPFTGYGRQTSVEFDVSAPTGTVLVLELERADKGNSYVVEYSAHTPVTIVNDLRHAVQGTYLLAGGLPPWQPTFFVPKGTTQIAIPPGFFGGIQPEPNPKTDVPDCHNGALGYGAPGCHKEVSTRPTVIDVGGADGTTWILNDPAGMQTFRFYNVPNVFATDRAHLIIPKSVLPPP